MRAKSATPNFLFFFFFYITFPNPFHFSFSDCSEFKETRVDPMVKAGIDLSEAPNKAAKDSGIAENFSFKL